MDPGAIVDSYFMKTRNGMSGQRTNFHCLSCFAQSPYNSAAACNQMELLHQWF